MDRKRDGVFRGWIYWLGIPIVLAALFVGYGLLQSRETAAELASTKSEHFVLYYEKGSLSDDSAARLLEQYNKAYRYGCVRLGYDPDELSALGLRIKEYLATRPGDMSFRGWFSSFGPVRYIDATRPEADLGHVMRIVVEARWGPAVPFLFNGVTAALSSEYAGEDIDSRAASLLEAVHNRSLADITDPGRFEDDSAVNSCLAGSFVHFLIRRFGRERLASWYRSITVFAPANGADFETAFGESFDAVEAVWRKHIAPRRDGSVDGALYAGLLREALLLQPLVESLVGKPLDEDIFQRYSRGLSALGKMQLSAADGEFMEVRRLHSRSRRLNALSTFLPFGVGALVGAAVAVFFLLRRRVGSHDAPAMHYSGPEI